MAPLAQELLTSRKWRARDLSGVIVSLGPGSYTGLRVGIVSAKTLAFATGCALWGVETFAAIARQAPTDASTIDVVADAQQGKIYVQRFVGGQPGVLRIEPVATWRPTLTSGCFVTGPALAIFGGDLGQEVRQASPIDWLPRPESLLTIALERQAPRRTRRSIHVGTDLPSWQLSRGEKKRVALDKSLSFLSPVLAGRREEQFLARTSTLCTQPVPPHPYPSPPSTGRGDRRKQS